MEKKKKTDRPDEGQKPQKRWDVPPGARTSDPEEQQVQRVWEEAKKKQQKRAERPGVDKQDLKQHDAQGNPTQRGEDIANGQ